MELYREVGDDEPDAAQHSEFLQAVASELAGRRFSSHIVPRSSIQPTKQPGAVVTNLVRSLAQAKRSAGLKKNLFHLNKKQPKVRAPFHKEANEKAHRTVNYRLAKAEVTKWHDVVMHTRMSEQIDFPLNQNRVEMQTVMETASGGVPRTALEIETARLLSKKTAETSSETAGDSVLNDEEKEALVAMSLSEARSRRVQIQKMRALVSQQEAKFKRQARIKSKGYRRTLRKEKQRQTMNELRELPSQDPEAALEKLERLEKDRIEERMTLKHGRKGKWARRMRQFGKNDPEIMNLIQQQLELGRELREKRVIEGNGDLDCETSDEEEAVVKEQSDGQQLIREWEPIVGLDNPWMKSAVIEMRKAKESNVVTVEAFENELRCPDEFSAPNINHSGSIEVSECVASDTRTVDADTTTKCDNISKLKAKKRRAKKLKSSEGKIDVEQDVEQEQLGGSSMQTINESLPRDEIDEYERKSLKQCGSVDSSEPTGTGPVKKKKKSAKKNTKVDKSVVVNILKDVDIDQLFDSLVDGDSTADIEASRPTTSAASNGFAVELKKTTKQNRKTGVSDLDLIDPRVYLKAKATRLKLDDAGDASDDDQEKLIAEAFADDGVLAEFEAESTANEEQRTAVDVQEKLPGWGSWTGPGMDGVERKKRVRRPAERKQFKSAFIVSDRANASVKKFQVKQLPFPYTSVDQFEKSLETPLGREWQSAVSHRELSAPVVRTRMGVKIDPIDKNSVFPHKKSDFIEL